jgi:hypothetical protein
MKSERGRSLGCPFRPSGYLQTGQSAQPSFSEQDCSEADVAELTQPAITRRSEFSSVAAIHFTARSEAVIELKALKFSAWKAAVHCGAVIAGA